MKIITAIVHFKKLLQNPKRMYNLLGEKGKKEKNKTK
jgi:hypothetical protein